MFIRLSDVFINHSWTAINISLIATQVGTFLLPGYIVFQMQKEQGVISSPCPNLFLCVNKLFIYNLCYLSANAIHTFYSYLCILFHIFHWSNNSRTGIQIIHFSNILCRTNNTDIIFPIKLLVNLDYLFRSSYMSV